MVLRRMLGPIDRPLTQSVIQSASMKKEALTQLQDQ